MSSSWEYNLTLKAAVVWIFIQPRKRKLTLILYKSSANILFKQVLEKVCSTENQGWFDLNQVIFFLFKSNDFFEKNHDLFDFFTLFWWFLTFWKLNAWFINILFLCKNNSFSFLSIKKHTKRLKLTYQIDVKISFLFPQSLLFVPLIKIK